MVKKDKKSKFRNRLWQLSLWLKVFTEGRGIKDKIILFPGTFFRILRFLTAYLKIPVLPHFFKMLSRPFLDVIIKNADGTFYCRKMKDDATMASEAYELPLQSYFDSFKEGVFVDIGANIGKYTIKIGRRSGTKGKVVSIEPEPGSFAILTKNIELNELKNVVPINVACWNEEGELDLSLASPFFHISGGHSVKKKVSSRFVKVKAQKLDFILNNLGIEEVNFIKVDVEGAEVEVLEGAQQIISKSPSLKILFEAFGEENQKRCFEMATKLGLHIRQIQRGCFLAIKGS